MIILNLVLSVLVLAAVYGLIWFVVTAGDQGARTDAQPTVLEPQDEQRLAA